MKSEIEARILEIEKEELIKKLEKIGARFIGNYNQKRYVYDFNPVISNKWIRLRNNGEKSSLTIKEIVNDGINGTKELEIEVSDFDITNLILNELGYNFRSYQENKRTRYVYNNIEIDIDTWPNIPTYVEFEGPDENELLDFIESLGYKKEDIITDGVKKIYKKYGKDIDAYKELKFENN